MVGIGGACRLFQFCAKCSCQIDIFAFSWSSDAKKDRVCPLFDLSNHVEFFCHREVFAVSNHFLDLIQIVTRCRDWTLAGEVVATGQAKLSRRFNTRFTGWTVHPRHVPKYTLTSFNGDGQMPQFCCGLYDISRTRTRRLGFKSCQLRFSAQAFKSSTILLWSISARIGASLGPRSFPMSAAYAAL